MRFLLNAAASIVIVTAPGCKSAAPTPITVSYNIENNQPDKNLQCRIDELPDLIPLYWKPAHSNQPTILIPIKDLIRTSVREQSNSTAIHDHIVEIKNVDLQVTLSGSVWYQVFTIHPSIEILTQNGGTMHVSLEARDCPRITFKAHRTVNSMFHDSDERRHWAEAIQQAVAKALIEANDRSLAIAPK